MTERLIVIDTNVALYYLGGRLVNPLSNARYNDARLMNLTEIKTESVQIL